MDQRTDKDKIGEELAAQRFRMLADIARELAGEVLFPTCFDVVLRLRRELQNPNISLPRLAQIVQLEPLVAAKLVRLANSAVYGSGGPNIRDLPTAIHRIGLNVVRTTALSVAMGEILHAKEIAGFSKLAQSLWGHSIFCATAARLLVAHTGTKSIRSEEALLAGLVHDLGAFYMLYRSVQYPELRERPDTVRYLIAQWHEAIGASLLKALGLPSDVVDAATDHDHSRTLPDVPKTLADVVYIGNLLAGGYRSWLDPDGKTREAQDEEVVLFREKYAEILPQVETEANSMHAALG